MPPRSAGTHATSRGDLPHLSRTSRDVLLAIAFLGGAASGRMIERQLRTVDPHYPALGKSTVGALCTKLKRIGLCMSRGESVAGVALTAAGKRAVAALRGGAEIPRGAAPMRDGRRTRRLALRSPANLRSELAGIDRQIAQVRSRAEREATAAAAALRANAEREVSLLADRKARIAAALAQYDELLAVLIQS